jgi:hypothetical protein
MGRENTFTSVTRLRRSLARLRQGFGRAESVTVI